jgi:hypothetical protein
MQTACSSSKPLHSRPRISVIGGYLCNQSAGASLPQCLVFSTFHRFVSTLISPSFQMSPMITISAEMRYINVCQTIPLDSLSRLDTPPGFQSTWCLDSAPSPYPPLPALPSIIVIHHHERSRVRVGKDDGMAVNVDAQTDHAAASAPFSRRIAVRILRILLAQRG